MVTKTVCQSGILFFYMVYHHYYALNSKKEYVFRVNNRIKESVQKEVILACPYP